MQAMSRRGHLDVPVIGVAKPNWTVEQLGVRAQQGIAARGGLDPETFNAPRTNSRSTRFATQTTTRPS
jgi:glucose-6-phosphate 1-dehydrogenase